MELPVTFLELPVLPQTDMSSSELIWVLSSYSVSSIGAACVSSARTILYAGVNCLFMKTQQARVSMDGLSVFFPFFLYDIMIRTDSSTDEHSSVLFHQELWNQQALQPSCVVRILRRVGDLGRHGGAEVGTEKSAKSWQCFPGMKTNEIKWIWHEYSYCILFHPISMNENLYCDSNAIPGQCVESIHSSINFLKEESQNYSTLTCT